MGAFRRAPRRRLQPPTRTPGGPRRFPHAGRRPRLRCLGKPRGRGASGVGRAGPASSPQLRREVLFWGGVPFLQYTPPPFFSDTHPLNVPLGRLSGFSRLHGNIKGRLQPGQRSLFPHESQPSLRSPQHPLESGPRRAASAQPGARRLRGHLPGSIPW